MEIINADAVSKYLVILFKRTGFGFEVVAEKSETSVATIKNMYYGKSENPGILTIHRVISVMGGSFEEMFSQGKTKEDLKEFSISSIKEMYEYQLAEQERRHKEHEENMRAHYEQHRKDYMDNVEKRLADKKEINTILKIALVVVGLFAALCFTTLVVLLILEVMNPELGWLRF